MVALGVLFIAAAVGIVVGIAANPEHSYRGWIAFANVVVLFASGLALAIHAL